MKYAHIVLVFSLIKILSLVNSTKANSTQNLIEVAEPGQEFESGSPEPQSWDRVTKSSTLEKPKAETEKAWWRNDIIINGGLILIVLILLFLRAWRKQKLDSPGRYAPSKLGTDYDVEQLILQGHEIDAIKLYMEKHKVDQDKAIIAVDNMVKGRGKTSRLTIFMIFHKTRARKHSLFLI